MLEAILRSMGHIYIIYIYIYIYNVYIFLLNTIQLFDENCCLKEKHQKDINHIKPNEE